MFASVCHDLRTEKNGFTLKSENLKETIGIQLTFTLEIKSQKYTFLQNMTIFLAAYVFFLNPS